MFWPGIKPNDSWGLSQPKLFCDSDEVPVRVHKGKNPLLDQLVDMEKNNMNLPSMKQKAKK